MSTEQVTVLLVLLALGLALPTIGKAMLLAGSAYLVARSCGLSMLRLGVC